MIPEIFKVDDNGHVELNPNILLIPTYKALWEYYHSLDIFSYINFMYHPESPYANYTDDEKEDALSEMFPGLDLYTLEYEAARDLFVKQCDTPLRKIYMGAKKATEKTVFFFENQQATGGRDGTIGQFKSFILESKKLMKAMSDTELAYKEELITARGGQAMTDDEEVDYDSNDWD